jgi:hypothetical protein
MTYIIDTLTFVIAILNNYTYLAADILLKYFA